MRIRALMVLLAAERRMVVGEIASIVRPHEETVRRWLARYEAEGLAGLSDAPRPGVPPKVRYRRRMQVGAGLSRVCLDYPLRGGLDQMSRTGLSAV